MKWLHSWLTAILTVREIRFHTERIARLEYNIFLCAERGLPTTIAERCKARHCAQRQALVSTLFSL